MRRLVFPLLVVCLSWVCARPVAAEPKVTMTASVPRGALAITIYNPAVSLIQEQRQLSLVKGLNEFRISWAGVNVTRDSVRLMLLDGAREVEIRDAVRPANDPNTVIWHLEAKRDGTYPISLSYYVGRFAWDADYVLTVDDQEKSVWLKVWADITNGTGEDYQDAKVRLVLGEVRLLSAGVAAGAPSSAMPTLAQPTPPGAPGPSGPAGAPGYTAGYGAAEKEAPAPFAREGFADYTFYDLARPESLDSGETKRIILAASGGLALRKVYTFDPELFGSNVAVRYWIENKKEYGLGPLPPGLVRVYRQDKDGGLSLLGEDVLSYVPVGETAKIYLGVTRNLIVEVAQTDYQRSDEQWAPDKSRLIQYTEQSAYKVTVKNRKPEAVELIVRQQIPTDAKLLEAQPKPNQPRLGLLEWTMNLAPGETRELTYRTSRTVYNR